MTPEVYNISRSKLLNEASDIVNSKGKSYQSSNDILSNFRCVADLMEVIPERVCYTYLMKHIISINSIIKGNPDPEGMRSRIMDAINYLIFLEMLQQDALS